MKFSEQWLREWVDPSTDTDDLAAQLTMAGLEVDAIEPVAGQFRGVVVAEILSAEPHPDAQKLQVCSVNAGDETVQIVCGAANARAGIKVPLAKVGAVLPDNFKIKKAKLRGVESFGMLCAEQELGMADSSDGLLELPLDAPVGEELHQYLNLNDTVIELGLTPNRADCLSIRGIAREAAVLNDMPFVDHGDGSIAASHNETLTVELEADEDCPRYVGRLLRNVDVSRPSPLWLQERLRRCGLRSIDAVVDVTNYIMLELGQPMHAFDLDQIDGGIVVRKAKAGDALAMLDGQTLELKPDSLVIADHSKPLALAGIMGGEPSSVTANTKHLFLEAAFFAPDKIAGRARSYGLHTDSSHRFERGVDYQLCTRAMERASELILTLCGGEAGPLITAESHALPKAQSIFLREGRIEKLLGMALLAKDVESILSGLGMAVERREEGWNVVPPSWRFDITIEVDLLEELARVYGYNRLPVSPISSELVIKDAPENRRPMSVVRQQLVGKGYQELITYSFVDPALQSELSDLKTVALRNPISSDMAEMRTSLLPGLLKAAMHNSKRQQSRLRFFETGLRFVQQADVVEQTPALAALLCGRREPESWNASADSVDFFDLKGDLESLLGSVDETVSFAASTHKALHPGQCADVFVGGELAGVIGALHPTLQRKYDFVSPVYVFEISLDFITRRRNIAFQELSRFPEVRRDLALIVDQHLPAQQLLDEVRASAGAYLINLKLFDIYQGKGIDPERKSLALGLTFRHSSRTLNEEEVNQFVEAVVSRLQEAFGAKLRN